MNETTRQNLQALLRRLTTAAATASLYNLQHQQVDYLCRQALEHFQAALDEQQELTLLRVDSELVCDNDPLPNDMAVERLLLALQQQGIGYLKLQRGLTREELLQLVALLSKRGLPIEELDDCAHLQLGTLEVKQAGNAETDDLFGKFPHLAELGADEMARFIELYQNVRAGKRLNVRGLQEIVAGFIQVLSEQGDPLLALAPLRELDEYSYTHSTNVCILNIAQARLLGLEGQQLYEIGIAAMLHDIGKLFVPQEVLQKPGKLDDDEWQQIQSHPQRGAEYLVNTPGVPRLAVITAYEHHMRYDGSGYPKAGQRWQQHLCSQMTTISDFFDALRTHRSYRAGMDFDKISSIMLEESGTALHPLLVRNFLAALKTLDQGSSAPAE